MKNENSELASLPVSNIIFSLWKNKLIIAIMALAGGLLGILFSFAKYIQVNNHPTYTISAAISILSENQDGMFSIEHESPIDDDVYLAQRLADAVIYVSTSNVVLNKVIAQLKLIGITEKELENALHLEQYKESQIITIRLTWDNPEEGVDILTALIDILPDILIQTLKIGSVEIVDEPQSVVQHSGGGMIYIILGAALGIFLVVVSLLLKFILRPTFITAQDIENMLDISVVGEIPHDSGVAEIRKGYSIADKSYPLSDEFGESYALAAHIIHNIMEKNQKKTLCITSALAGEGKTTVAINLALYLSKMSKKVLLVDWDVRKPSIGSILLCNYDSDCTLNEIYLKKVTAKDASIKVNEYLDVIPATLERERVQITSELLEEIKAVIPDYDYVLFDSSSAGAVADPMSLKQITDQVLFVIKQDGTWVELIIDSMSKMGKSGMQIMGCVFNEIDMKTPGNRYFNKNLSGQEAHITRKKNRKQNEDSLNDDYVVQLAALRQEQEVASSEEKMEEHEKNRKHERKNKHKKK